MNPDDLGNKLNKKIGILGGGQLGRMLFEASIDLDVELHFMDPDPAAPCANLGASFRVGDINDKDTVVEFGKNLDIITIEIERVSRAGLDLMENQGKEVYPSANLIGIVQNKILQKGFFEEHGFPTAPFKVVKNLTEIRALNPDFPFVNKIGEGGYDGRGVSVIRSEGDMNSCFDAPGIIEEMADIQKEISVIVARNKDGEVTSFPAVEMVFDPRANLVDFLISPARVDRKVEIETEALANSLAEKMDLVGIMAIEMFLLNDGRIWINEVAPRPHNSGHQSIEGNYTSQYQQHLRAILDLPLGNTDTILPSAMVNLLGEEGYEGEPIFEGMDEILGLKGAYVHLYGKKRTKPFRKMGHVTLVDEAEDQLPGKVEMVKKILKVKS